jgi:hypothetical protein
MGDEAQWRGREMAWRRDHDGMGFEIASLHAGGAGAILKGAVSLVEDGAPLLLEYQILCDQAWRTRQVSLRQAFRGGIRTMALARKPDNSWTVDGDMAPELSGCLDVDIAVTPSTNALPINRLRLPVGERADAVAAWVQVPSLEVTPLAQSYERVSECGYRYRALKSGFEAHLDVDDLGLPIAYGAIWRRMGLFLEPG